MTREVEIEGTEAFVERYFKAIEDLFTSLRETKSKPNAKQMRAPRKERNELGKRKSLRRDLRKGDIFQMVVRNVQESDTGMTTDSLMKATGFTQQQVRSVIFRAEKQGVIRRLQRGIYAAAVNAR